jgi:hypothetical protein
MLYPIILFIYCPCVRLCFALNSIRRKTEFHLHHPKIHYAHQSHIVTESDNPLPYTDMLRRLSKLRDLVGDGPSDDILKYLFCYLLSAV